MPWSFKGLDFGVVADGPIFNEWFRVNVRRTIDPVLSGGGTPRRYVDLGSLADVPPLSLVAQWKGTNASTDRATMKTYRGTIGLLEDDDGRSCQALLAETEEFRVVSTSSGYTRLAVVFEYIGPAS